MPLIALLLTVVALLLSLDGWESTREATRRPADGSFTVMTFNIQHGMSARGTYNLPRVVELIARISPDVVGLQETTRNHPYYGCDDQPKLIAEGLTRATGRTWHHAYQQEWFTPDVSCLERGAGDGKETEGLTLLSPHPVEKVAHTDLWNTRIGLAVQLRGIGSIPIVVTHLSSGAKGREDRHRQVGPLLAWARGLGSPRILMGDLNMSADAEELQPITRDYRDAWAEAVAGGRARGITNGSTRVGKAGRIDFIMFTPAPSLTLEWVETIDSSRIVGEAVSDHQPVLAAFKIGRP